MFSDHRRKESTIAVNLSGQLAMRVSAPRMLLLLAAALLIASVAFHPAAAAAHTSLKKSKSAPPPPTSAVFPLYGDVYPQGFYYVAMNIGDPPKPYFLDVDSGSDLTWLQCDAPCVNCQKCPHPWYKPVQSKLVSNKDPLCTSLRISTGQVHGTVSDRKNDQGNEDSSARQCDYEINYADSGSSLGVLVADNFAMRLVNGSIVRPALAFGCGYDQQGGGTTSPTDGVLGLGRGPSGVLAQLSSQGVTRNIVGHCLSSRGGGFLFFGDDLVPASGVTWVPMSTNVKRYYSPGPAGIYYGKESLDKEMQLVFDSGSSYTYFGMAPYQALITKMKRDMTGKPLKEADEDPTLPFCWKGPKPLKSVIDVRKYFRMLVLIFLSGKKQRVQLEIPPENYLIISRQGNACLGILNGTEVGLNDNLNIIGDISLQDMMVVYDNEGQQIGWTRANCDRLPNADETAAGFQEPAVCQPYFNSIGILTQGSQASYS